PTGSLRGILHRRGGLMYLHRDFHVRNSHDSNLPFYSNWSEVGVSRHIGTGGLRAGCDPLLSRTERPWKVYCGLPCSYHSKTATHRLRSLAVLCSASATGQNRKLAGGLSID